MASTCTERVGNGFLTYQCNLPTEHAGPHRANEVAVSVRQRATWEREQAAGDLAQFQGPAQTTAERYTQNPSPVPITPGRRRQHADCEPWECILGDRFSDECPKFTGAPVPEGYGAHAAKPCPARMTRGHGDNAVCELAEGHEGLHFEADYYGKPYHFQTAQEVAVVTGIPAASAPEPALQVGPAAQVEEAAALPQAYQAWDLPDGGRITKEAGTFWLYDAEGLRTEIDMKVATVMLAPKSGVKCGASAPTFFGSTKTCEAPVGHGGDHRASNGLGLPEMTWTSTCTGATDCPARVHTHGCYADLGMCDTPQDHLSHLAGAPLRHVRCAPDALDYVMETFGSGGYAIVTDPSLASGSWIAETHPTPVGVPTKQREGDQVLPTGDEAIEDDQALLIADIEARRQVGIERYGQGHRPFNGRDTLLDLYEEQLDGLVYLRSLRRMSDAAREDLVAAVAQAFTKEFAGEGHLRLDQKNLEQVATLAVDRVMGWVTGRLAQGS